MSDTKKISDRLYNGQIEISYEKLRKKIKPNKDRNENKETDRLKGNDVKLK